MTKGDLTIQISRAMVDSYSQDLQLDVYYCVGCELEFKNDKISNSHTFFADNELEKGIDHNKDIEVDKFTVTQDIVTRRSHRKVDLELGTIKMPQHSLNDQESSIGDEEYEEFF